MKEAQKPDPCVARSHNEKRLSIIDSAARVFCREGFGGANIDLVAAEAGVSRQTVYNHHGDKANLFASVVRDISERINAGLFETLDTFPDHPKDLETELVSFAMRLNGNCLCNRDGRFLNKLIQTEGDRYPELFAAWRENGPGRLESALGARFARLALSGHLDIEDPDTTARQFLALVKSDVQIASMLGETITDDQLLRSAQSAVRTFLRAFGKRGSGAAGKLPAVAWSIADDTT